MGCGLAGALMANVLRFTSPDLMNWTKSGELIVMVILGGMGTFFGPILGAAAFLILETYLGGLSEHWPVALGAILLVIVLLTKGGVAGLIDRALGPARR
jgi:branched-chain amino acid transport system permease protein